ncbi:MAG: hypothetical protein OXC39_07305 [Candidatus Dadabacteria bacterium]|nr:hypothetical protein [Candidatus Dadabacteria bacterium]
MKKTTIIALLFCCVSVLAVVFADTRSAFADHGVTAEQAASIGTKEAMENFLQHVRSHFEQVLVENVEFRNTLRRDGGDYRHNKTYSIIVNQTNPDLKAGELIYVHAEHRTASSGSLRDIEVFERLMTEVEKVGEEEVACVEDDGTHGNHICAGKAIGTSEIGSARIPVIVIVGFHNELDEVKFIVECPEFTPEDLQSRGWQSAEMVNDEESLKRYLKGVEAHISEEVQKPFFPLLPLIQRIRSEGRFPTPDEQAELGKATAEAVQLLISLQHCWRQAPWKSGSIYFYMIQYDSPEGAPAGTPPDGTIQFGVFNGITAEFHDRHFRLYDGCLNVGRAVFDEVTKDDDTPNEGFLRYYWTNPDLEGADGVNDENGNPIEGLSPGTSVKLGYFIRTNFGLGEDYLVLGSGIYPEGETYYEPESGKCEDPPDTLPESSREYLSNFPSPPEKEDDGGCAIASGGDNKLKIAAFNLFLIAAVLFLAVSRKSRLGGKFQA